MLFYRAAFPLTHRTLSQTAFAIRAQLVCYRFSMALPGPRQQDLLARVYLYKREPLTRVVAGFKIAATIVRRYVHQTTRLLLEHVPTLGQGLRCALQKG